MSTVYSPEEKVADRALHGPVALIAGPTASGKSDLAIELALQLQARRRDAVIINADSMQVYSDLQVVSARPTAEEMRGVPHRLFGTWDGAHACSTADWAAAAREEVDQTHAGGAIPILVGGTGLYLQTLLEGIAPIPEIANDTRSRVRSLAKDELRKNLAELDPQAMSRIGENDTQRMSRALEVVLSTGKTLGHWQKYKTGGIQQEIDLHPLIMLPEREWLYSRCNARFEWMLDNGAMDEVATLLERQLHPDLPVMRAIGVPEIAAEMAGRSIDPGASLKERGGASTRQYAKRQYTWFRNQSPAWWPRDNGEGTKNAIISRHFELLLQ